MKEKYIVYKAIGDLSKSAFIYITPQVTEETDLVSVYFHADTAITETVKVIHVDYDLQVETTIEEAGLVNGQNFVLQASPREIPLEEGDQIKVTCTNDNATGKVATIIKMIPSREV